MIHETLISVPILFPPDFDSRYGNKNLYLLVSGLARRLVEPDTKMAAFISMMKISDVVGAKTLREVKLLSFKLSQLSLRARTC